MPLRLSAILAALGLAWAACTVAGTTQPPPSTTGSPTSTVPTVTNSSQETQPQPPQETPPKDPITLQIEELMAVTERIRGLEFLSTPVVILVSEEEMAQRVEELFEEDLEPEEYAAYDALYSTLGLLPGDVDLEELLRLLETEQVVAFYDTETKELVAPSEQEELTPIEKLTMVHELTHAVTDQYYDLFGIMDRLDAEQRFDDASAFRALVEGDAMVVEFLYLQELPREEQVQVLQEAMQIETPIFDTSPRFLQDSLLFPYIEGQEFVSGIWTADGFGGVDDAYLSYPSTTEHIYRPGKYFASEQAVPVSVPVFELSGYQAVETSTWGYLGFQTMFDQVLGGADADRASDGWGGDSYRLFSDGVEVILALSYVGDSTEDAVELQAVLIDFITQSMDVAAPVPDGRGSAFAGNDYAFVSRIGDQVVFVAASDPSAGEEARLVFQGF